MKELYWYTEWAGKRLGANKIMRGNSSGLYGDCSRIYGDATGVTGDCTGFTGKMTDLFGALDDIDDSIIDTNKLKHVANRAVDVDPT